MLDGESADLPAFELIPAPHPEDKEYHKSKGEDYWPPLPKDFEEREDIVTVHGKSALHEIYSQRGKDNAMKTKLNTSGAETGRLPTRTTETFEEAKLRIINELAKPFAEKAAKVFEKMDWTWAGVLGADVHPNEKNIYETICKLLNRLKGETAPEEIDKLGHHYCATGRICIAMFKWPHSKEWDIRITLNP